MDIVANNGTKFDSIIREARESAPRWAALDLERVDRAIYSAIDHSRFRLISVRRRTIMTSIGEVTYSRRCYFDGFGEAYIYPLDMLMGIRKRAKVSTELKREAVAKAAFMSYALAGETCSQMGFISKSTVCRAVRSARVSAAAKRKFAGAAAIHLQIDEKYMGFLGSKRKRPRYTATIHCGTFGIGRKKRRRLAKRLIVSATSPAKLARKINSLLRDSYGVGIDDEIWLSGDLASYIRSFGERITCCSTKYVPDKWHVCKALSDAYPEFGAIPPSAVEGIMDLIIEIGDLTRLEKANALDLVSLYRSDPACFSRWGDDGYAGCSQEGMNSHYYAPRFSKLASRFKPETVEKLCKVIEARQNGTGIRISIGGKEPESVDDLPWLGKAYEERMRYDIDTSEMKEGLRKVIDSLRYGGLL